MHKDVCFCPAGLSVISAWGFTLIELLITLSIVSILLFVAMPNMSQWVVDSRIAETRHRLRAALSLARSEAVRRGVRVTLCTTSDRQSCDGDARSGKSIWSQALLFKDHDDDRLYFADDKDELIRVLDLTVGGQVLWNRGDSTVYESDGSLLGGANGSFYIFDSAEMNQGVKLVLQMTGRVREAKFSNKDITYVDQYLGH